MSPSLHGSWSGNATLWWPPTSHCNYPLPPKASPWETELWRLHPAIVTRRSGAKTEIEACGCDTIMPITTVGQPCIDMEYYGVQRCAEWYCRSHWDQKIAENRVAHFFIFSNSKKTQKLIGKKAILLQENMLWKQQTILESKKFPICGHCTKEDHFRPMWTIQKMRSLQNLIVTLYNGSTPPTSLMWWLKFIFLGQK